MEEIIQTQETLENQDLQRDTETQQNIPQSSRKRMWPIFLGLGLIALVAAFFLTGNLRQYARAGSAYERRDYQQAAELYAGLGDYRDAAQKEAGARYLWAGELEDQKDYAGALAIYESLGDYKESVKRAKACNYYLADAAFEAGQLEQAVEYYALATDEFRDAKDRRLYAIYQLGHEAFLDGAYADAQQWFDRLEGWWPQSGGPHFETFDEALDYISTQAQQLPERITVVIRNMPGSYILRSDLLNSTVQQRLGYQYALVDYNKNTCALTVFPSYYPGQRIIHAWKNDDFSGLSVDELSTYQKARRLVHQAQAANPDPEAVELWLHDWICENVEYDSPYEYVYPEDFVGLNELTCVGAILSGKANCQGYTDAFYLLGTLAGLDVCVMFGTAEGGGHCWNGVRLDGKLYMVDVTFNDTYFREPEYWTYIWYNNILDLDVYTISSGSTLFPGLVTRKDLSKTYYAYTDSVYEDLGYAAYGLLRQYRLEGAGVYHAVVDSANQTDEDLYKAIANNMGLASVGSARWYADLYTYEDDTYIWIEWVEE